MIPNKVNSLERSELEQRIAEVIAKFHRDQQGHAPAECVPTLMGDMAIVVSRGIFTPTETTLSRSEEGRKLIQSARREQRALTRRDVEAEVSRVLGRRVLRSYFDLDVRVAEQIEVYMLAEVL